MLMAVACQVERIRFVKRIISNLSERINSFTKIDDDECLC